VAADVLEVAASEAVRVERVLLGGRQQLVVVAVGRGG
jgi:hypothetical protein